MFSQKQDFNWQLKTDFLCCNLEHHPHPDYRLCTLAWRLWTGSKRKLGERRLFAGTILGTRDPLSWRWMHRHYHHHNYRHHHHHIHLGCFFAGALLGRCPRLHSRCKDLSPPSLVHQWCIMIHDLYNFHPLSLTVVISVEIYFPKLGVKVLSRDIHEWWRLSVQVCDQRLSLDSIEDRGKHWGGNNLISDSSRIAFRDGPSTCGEATKRAFYLQLVHKSCWSPPFHFKMTKNLSYTLSRETHSNHEFSLIW